MLFSSVPFLYYFLPCVLLLYFSIPKKFKNLVLLLASLIFYAWGEPKYVVLMVCTTVFAYISGLLIEKFRESWVGNFFLGLFVLFSLAALGYFKYADFFIANFNTVFAQSVPLLKIALPIGISFYTFQTLSYVIDVYRGEVYAQRNFIALAAYVALFPQLIAGPIVRYSDIAQQLSGRRHSLDKIAVGVRRFVLGLGKKVLIANALGELCGVFRASEDKSVMFYWLYAIAFTLQIYFDFSGYSDMAIGLGKLFGFDFMENFNYPYISSSITEFWRRWHISLGSWFRDYVYIPLGGNRVSRPRWFLNIFIVWMLTGLWHGAAWNFIIWGLFFAVLLTMEKFWFLKALKKSKIVGHIYVLLLVMISFVIFNATDMAQAFSDIASMFGVGGFPLVSGEFWYYLQSYGTVLILAMIGATPLPEKIIVNLRRHRGAETILSVAEPVFLIVLLLTVTAYLVDGTFNPFLYFRF